MREFPHYAVSSDDAVYRLAIPKLNKVADSDDSHAEAVEDLVAGSREWILSRLNALALPGIRIDFGFSPKVDIMSRGRLATFACSLADRIREIAGEQLVSIKLSKSHEQETTLSIAEAIVTRPAKAVATATVSTRRSYATPRFASEVHDATEQIRTSIRPGHPLGLDLSYLTGLPRTWSRLWLPTITGIFSKDLEASMFRDTEIVELGLHHHSVGEPLGHGVNISASLYLPG
ncbi:hypothetical protein [Mycobacterium marinum]|uniref:hypothetical protein n=1 Tax=Mycobacterium marinum TaxID=1781 RepID=UPI00114080AE|nr:hypothetical protein [Mycobacterium marinum]